MQASTDLCWKGDSAISQACYSMSLILSCHTTQQNNLRNGRCVAEILSLKTKSIYLLQKSRGRKRGRNRETQPDVGSPPEQLWLDHAKPGTPSGSLCRGQGPNHVGHMLLPCTAHQQEARSQAGQGSQDSKGPSNMERHLQKSHHIENCRDLMQEKTTQGSSQEFILNYK